MNSESDLNALGRIILINFDNVLIPKDNLTMNGLDVILYLNIPTLNSLNISANSSDLNDINYMPLSIHDEFLEWLYKLQNGRPKLAWQSMGDIEGNRLDTSSSIVVYSFKFRIFGVNCCKNK